MATRQAAASFQRDIMGYLLEANDVLLEPALSNSFRPTALRHLDIGGAPAFAQ
jgi:hypothetical protein